MRVTREQAARNRDAVVEAASRLFRERGIGGVGIADIMRESGLTHGGFYGQFASKDDLAGEACARALDASAARWRGIVAGHAGESGEGMLAAIAGHYLRAAHLTEAGTGCALPALAADAARDGGAVARAFTEGFLGLEDVLEKALSGEGEEAGDSREASRQRALAALAQMVGALVLARAVDDPALSCEIMSAARLALGAEALG
jgi:TetR/AcrR family transcriptional repressor of nem operon